MPGITVRTRADRATLTVPCHDADPHRIVISRDGLMQFDSVHNVEHDAVMQALGAEPHPCQKALAAYYAAQEVFHALTGVADSNDAYVGHRNGQTTWRSRTACGGCNRGMMMGHSLSHLHSVGHLAGSRGADERAAQTLLRWMIRHSEFRNNVDHYMQPVVSQTLLDRYNVPFSAVWGNLWITDAYIDAAAVFLHEDADTRDFLQHVRLLRTGGVKVQWLTELVTRLTPRTRERIKQDLVSASSLIGARNLPAENVARYINAGIRANFYTYARVNAQPEQVLAYYHATGSTRTLADDLRDGLTIPDALARIAP